MIAEAHDEGESPAWVTDAVGDADGDGEGEVEHAVSRQAAARQTGTVTRLRSKVRRPKVRSACTVTA